jgi:hypothetical protein
MHTGFLSGNLKGETSRKTRRRCEDNIGMDLCGKIGGKGSCGLDASGSRCRQVAGSCEHGNEPSGVV